VGAGARRHAGYRARTAPRTRSNPLIDNGFMYTTDGWGTVYKIDARQPQTRASSSGSPIPACGMKANVPRQRAAIALWDDLVIANLPDGRVIAINRDSGEIVWDKQIAQAERVRHQGKVLHRPDHRRRQDHHRKWCRRRGGRAAGWAALDAQDRERAVALVRRAQARRSRQRDLEGQQQLMEDRRRRRPVADRLLRFPRASSRIWGTGNPVPQYDPMFASGRQPLHQFGGGARRRDRQARLGTTNTRPTTRGTMMRTASTCSTTPRSTGENRKVVGHFGRNGFFYTLDRANGSFIKGGPVRERSELDQRARSQDRESRSNTIPSSTCRNTSPTRRALRGDGMKRALPDLARRRPRTSRSHIIRSRRSPMGSASRAASRRMGAAAAFKSPEGGLDRPKFEKRTYTSDLYYGSITAYDTVNHKVVGEGDHRYRDPLRRDSHRRRPWCSPRCRTAGVIAYKRRDAGGALALQRRHPRSRARPVTYAVGPKQFLAVQTSGRHLHPVKYDKLENSSYLFVFALN